MVKSQVSSSEHASAASLEPAVSYSMSDGFVEFLDALNIAVGMTSYQSGRLYLLSRNPKGGLMVNEHIFDKAMGLSVDGNGFLLASSMSILRFENILRPGEWIDETYTHCYIPRTTHFTGILDAHDVGMAKNGDVLFVNTRYNCVATLSRAHSFKPVWRPVFISELVAEDRCHLNGMAIDNGELRYVTAVSNDNTDQGWRNHRRDGGVVIETETNEIICDGLSMPHSPRIHRGKLWVLNSGKGEFGWIESKIAISGGKFHKLAFCPGFLRGLAFHGRYAFIGLSKPRDRHFEGLELDVLLGEAKLEPWSGMQVIDLDTGTCIHWFRIEGSVSEMYDLAVLPGVGCAQSIGFSTDDAHNLITVEL